MCVLNRKIASRIFNSLVASSSVMPERKIVFLVSEGKSYHQSTHKVRIGRETTAKTGRTRVRLGSRDLCSTYLPVVNQHMLALLLRRDRLSSRGGRDWLLRFCGATRDGLDETTIEGDISALCSAEQHSPPSRVLLGDVISP